MNVITLLNGVTATGAGQVIDINPKRLINGYVPFMLTGITTATVELQVTMNTKAEIDAGTATWQTLANGTFVEDTAEAIVVAFPFMKANVTAYTAGTITAKIWL